MLSAKDATGGKMSLEAKIAEVVKLALDSEKAKTGAQRKLVEEWRKKAQQYRKEVLAVKRELAEARSHLRNTRH
jgi:hypothetical protein